MKSKLNSLSLLFLFTWVFIACSPKSDPDIPVEAVKLSNRTVTLVKGESATIKVDILPVNASDQTVEWSTDDKNIAEVSEGNIKAKKQGKTIIFAKSGGKTASCIVQVVEKKIPTQSITFNHDELKIIIGGKLNLDYTLVPVDATDRPVWSSSDESVATVADGEIKALSVGKTEIKVVSGTKSATCILHVKLGDAKVDELTISPKELKMEVGDVKLVEAEVKADRPDDVVITWTSSDEKTATVLNGRINAIAPGTAEIKAVAGEHAAVCKVQVVKKDYAVKQIEIAPANLKLIVEQTQVLAANVIPEDALADLEWKSSNEKVAIVSEFGQLTALSAGKTTITASAGGKTASCEVLVQNKISVENFKIEVTNIKPAAATISFTPPNDDMTYYCYGMSKARYDYTLQDPEIKKISDFDMAFWKAQGADQWKEAMRKELKKGSISLQLDEYSGITFDDTEYILYCYGLDSEGVMTTDIKTYSFKTLPKVKSDNQIKLEISEIFSDGFTGKVTTTNKDGYYITMQRARFVESYQNLKKEGKLVNGQDPIKYMLFICMSGDKQNKQSSIILRGDTEIDRYYFGRNKKPNTKYYIILVGYDEDHGFYTEPVYQNLTTLPRQ
ncbi:Ig-like domain-containing protein [Porphyromonas macacae]|uniref:Bacterial Ig-like domain (Group 2) n=1 Tax=Porphyromonas macacae TaxID=28115 RepID=A0A379DKK0_9PORP|nr:Ig-like domain-containing protein [Porphyromonas macacae]SUB78702.1 Bacterial Ig-like domain (group 2) [Porphyromonas macacae]